MMYKNADVANQAQGLSKHGSGRPGNGYVSTAEGEAQLAELKVKYADVKRNCEQAWKIAAELFPDEDGLIKSLQSGDRGTAMLELDELGSLYDIYKAQVRNEQKLKEGKAAAVAAAFLAEFINEMPRNRHKKLRISQSQLLQMETAGGGWGVN